MENATPVSYGQDTLLPCQKQSEQLKKLQVSLERIERAKALQVWRLSVCPHLSDRASFVDNFGRLVELQDFVMAQLDAIENFKTVA